MADFNKKNIEYIQDKKDLALRGLVECEEAAKAIDKTFRKFNIYSDVEVLLDTYLKCYILFNESEKLLKIMEKECRE